MPTVGRVLVALVVAVALVAACGAEPPPVPSAPTATAPVSPTARPTETPAPSPIAPLPTPSPRPIPSATATPSPTPSPVPTTTPGTSAVVSQLLPITGSALINDCRFELEVARSPVERSIGLMGRTGLPEERAMLFWDSSESILEFWMANTLIPLDIVFIGADLLVVDVQTMLPERLTVYPSAAPAQYALEMNAGRAAACGIEPGVSRVTLTLDE